MLKLSLEPREPFWIEADHIAPGVRFYMAPVTPAVVLVARDAAARAMIDGPGAEADAGARGQAAFTSALVRRGLLAWEGVGDGDGKPIEPSPQAIDALLAHWQIFDLFDARYAAPELSRLQEKNASAPSLNGISAAGAKPTVATARGPARNVHTH